MKLGLLISSNQFAKINIDKFNKYIEAILSPNSILHSALILNQIQHFLKDQI